MLTWLRGAMPLFTCLWTTPAGKAHADVLRGLDPAEGRKARQVALHERLHGCEIEAPHEDEGEVAGIGEAVLVERERLVEVHPCEAFRREGLRA